MMSFWFLLHFIVLLDLGLSVVTTVDAYYEILDCVDAK